MANTMIDLGEVRREQPAPPVEPGVALPRRGLLAALSIVLLALLGGAEASLAPAPRIIPALLADSPFLDGDRMFLVTAGPQPADRSVQYKVVDAYTLPGGRLVSQTTVAVTGSVSGVVQAGDVLLVSYQLGEDPSNATVALRVGTDRALWRLQAGLAGASAEAGIALLSSGFLSQNQPAWSAVDLHTGAVRWTVPEAPGGGVVLASDPVDGYPRWLVTIPPDGRLVTRDALTGRIVAARDGPPLDLPNGATSWVTGDLAVIGGPAGGVTGYRLPDLTPLWTSDVDLRQTWLQGDCGEVLCAFRPQQGVDVLDPATGRLLWTSDRWAYAESAGRYLVASALDPRVNGPSFWVLDARTGRVLGDFGRWDVLPSDTAGPLYGSYLDPVRGTLLYGVLDPATGTARVLGGGVNVHGGCQISAGALICRLNDASVVIWSLG